MSFTLCTSGAITQKAGIGVSTSGALSGGLLAEYSDQAEGFLSATTRYDWVGNYAKIGANFKPMLADAASSLAGAQLVAFDMSGYVGRGYANDIINVLHDKATRIIRDLNDDKTRTAMGAT